MSPKQNLNKNYETPRCINLSVLPWLSCSSPLNILYITMQLSRITSVFIFKIMQHIGLFGFQVATNSIYFQFFNNPFETLGSFICMMEIGFYFSLYWRTRNKIQVPRVSLLLKEQIFKFCIQNFSYVFCFRCIHFNVLTVI